MDFEKAFDMSKLTIVSSTSYNNEKKTRPAIQCPLCGKVLRFGRTEELKVMCGDKEIVHQESYMRTKRIVTSEHYIPVPICKDCATKRKRKNNIIFVISLIVVPVIALLVSMWVTNKSIIEVYPIGIVALFVGAIISGIVLNSKDELTMDIDEAIELNKKYLEFYSR